MSKSRQELKHLVDATKCHLTSRENHMSIKGRVLKILAQREELFSMSVELRVGIRVCEVMKVH